MKILTVILGFIASAAWGQLPIQKLPAAWDTPIAALPKGLNAPAGSVTLVTDFTVDKANGQVVVYLVNRSDRDIKLDAQDGDVYLKLEILTESGAWIRAQPHASSWCGNSYMHPPTLRNEHFLRINGYQPKEGRKAKIRYRLYNQENLDLTTQAGDGLCLDSDIQNAASDAWAVFYGSLDFVTDVAIGKIKPVNRMDHMQDLQEYAIDTLASGRFPAERVLPILNVVALKFPQYKGNVESAKRRLKNIKKGD